jgi:hypothetical protein
VLLGHQEPVAADDRVESQLTPGLQGDTEQGVDGFLDEPGPGDVA